MECTDAPVRENTNLCVIVLKVLFPQSPLNFGIAVKFSDFFFLSLGRDGGACF